jgi:hypothetical protein
LATAYAVLDALRHKPDEEPPPDLKKCYRAVVVVTPRGNHALTEKWHREVEALQTRCSRELEKTRWFRSKVCASPDELLQAMYQADDRRRKVPVVLVAEAGIFTKRLADPAVRFFTACLFRWWGNGLRMRERYHLVRGLSHTSGSWAWWDAATWVSRGEYEIDLWNWRDHERFLSAKDTEREEWGSWGERRLFAEVSLRYEQVERALRLYTRKQGEERIEALRQLCKDVPQRIPGDRRTEQFRRWSDYFYSVKDQLRDLYKELWPYLLEKDFPLVIADEAHHWRHAQRQDCRAFRQFVAPFARRLLLLTATPFQLHRDELLEVLATTDSMEPAVGAERVESLRERRDRLAEAMNASEEAGRDFSREWGALTEQFARLDPRFSTLPGRLPAEEDLRTQEIERHWRVLRAASREGRKEVLQEAPGALRPFFARAVELHDANRRLQDVMAPLILRHRRQTEHRRYWVGREYPPDASGQSSRPDRSQLHLAPGQPMPPHGELAQYLLMKVVAEISRGKHRTTLGMDLTGCYTTLWQSREGSKAVETALQAGQHNLLDLLKRITGYGQEDNPRDAKHPKVETVVEEVLRRWDQGEKSLVFCFRVPTAKTLYRLLSQAVEKRLRAKRLSLFRTRGTERGDDFDPDKAMQQFRRSLTAREGSGVPLFLDRVLLGWLATVGRPLPRFTREDLGPLADLCARALNRGRPLFPDFERPDRVFLNRAVEHVLAQRLLRGALDFSSLPPDRATDTKELLGRIADEEWVRFRYGDRQLILGRGGESEDESQRSEQVARTSLAAAYDLLPSPDLAARQAVLRALEVEPPGKRPRVMDTLLSGPNLFVPLGNVRGLVGQAGWERIGRMRRLIFDVTLQEGEWHWRQRAQVLDAVVRAFLREDILLRLPPDVFRGEDETWSESLLRGLHQVPTGDAQLEPVAARVEEFLRELSEMGGEEREAHLRYAMNPRAESVVLVAGSSKVDRDAVFSGFNTPLLPDILVCTQVGQEGIDLHRHCRHVIHYDLGWNPAAIEQRTGRTDRIGSKAARERKMALQAKDADNLPENQLPGLDIAMPYLAGTYDERMFERLRTRAQVFDILTGGDPTADQESGSFWLDPDSEGEDDGTSFVPLPRQMLDDLRVDLAVNTQPR